MKHEDLCVGLELPKSIEVKILKTSATFSKEDKKAVLKGSKLEFNQIVPKLKIILFTEKEIKDGHLGSSKGYLNNIQNSEELKDFICKFFNCKDSDEKTVKIKKPTEEPKIEKESKKEPKVKKESKISESKETKIPEPKIKKEPKVKKEVKTKKESKIPETQIIKEPEVKVESEVK